MRKSKIFAILFLSLMTIGLFACDPPRHTVNYFVVNDVGGALTIAVDGWNEFKSGYSFRGNGIYNLNFTATPNEGWQVKEWKRNGEVVKDDNDLIYKSLTCKITTKASDWDAAVKGTLNISIEFEEMVKGTGVLTKIEQ